MQYLELPEEAMHQLTMMPSIELVNENIVGNLMLRMLQSDRDILKFCDIIEEVLNTVKGKKFIRSLRNRKFKYSNNIANYLISQPWLALSIFLSFLVRELYSYVLYATVPLKANLAYNLSLLN